MDSPRPAVIVLGAMFGARYPNLLPAAAARGLDVLGVDVATPGKQRFDAARRDDPDHPLAGLAELVWIAGDRHEEILEQALRWAVDRPIRGVLAFGEDFVEAAALVADRFDLPGPGLRASRVCRNKLLQRRYLGFASPPSRLLPPAGHPDAAVDWGHFPAVVKPTGGEASSGVQRVDDAAELRAALDGYDDGEALLLERMITGHEVSVEALVQHGRVLFDSVTGKRTNETGGSYFVEMGHTAPDPDSDAESRARVLAVNRAVLDRLAFADGIAHAEYRVTADGSVYLMEIAARAAGDSILGLYHLATGEPMEPALLAIAIGEPASYPPPRRYARQVYLEHQPGVLRDVRVDDPGLPQPWWLPEHWKWPAVTPFADEPGNVHMIVAGRARGDALAPIRQSADRSVMFVVDAPTPSELDDLEARCTKAITIDVEVG